MKLTISLKRKTLLGIIALTMFMPNAMAQRDVLLETNHATAIVGTNDFLIPAVSQETRHAVKQFAQKWTHARYQILMAKEHQSANMLSNIDKIWLKDLHKSKTYTNKRTYAYLFKDKIMGRVHFYERSHNWNGENEADKYYNYMMYPGAHNKGMDMYTNSYGFNVLRTMADKMSKAIRELDESNLQGQLFTNAVEERLLTIMEETQRTVYNDELRYYINNTVWYTTKQVVKERQSYEKSLN